MVVSALRRLRPGFLDTRAHTALGLTASGLLIAWLLLPALTPTHVEGFSASIQALGVHLARGSLADYDWLQPLNGEYFGLTKLGAVLAIALLTGPFGLGSALAFRLVMWASLMILLAATAWLVRRWSGARWLFVLPPLILLPGIVESAFLFDDNMLSAALGALGLCLCHRAGVVAALMAGALFGLAVLTRTDTIFIGVAVPFIVAHRQGLGARTALTLLLTGGSAASVFVGTLASFGASPLDLLTVAGAAMRAWNRPAEGRWVLTTIFFFSAPGLLLVGAGLAVLVRRRTWPLLARLGVAPLLLILVLGGKLWEVRQLLAMTPFFCALATIGLRAIVEGPANGPRRWLRPALGAFTLVSLMGPIAGLADQDGPRVLAGRVWTIPIWRAWQQGLPRDLGTMARALAPDDQRGPVLVLANHWNEERFLHLMLLDRGYAVDRAGLPSACVPVAELFARGSRRVVIVRNHQSFVPYGREVEAERYEHLSLPCLRSFGARPAVLLATAFHAGKLLPDAARRPLAGPLADDPRRDHRIDLLSYGPIVAIRLDPAGETALLAAYRRDAATRREPGKPVHDWVEAEATTRARLNSAFSR